MDGELFCWKVGRLLMLRERLLRREAVGCDRARARLKASRPSPFESDTEGGKHSPPPMLSVRESMLSSVKPKRWTYVEGDGGEELFAVPAQKSPLVPNDPPRPPDGSPNW